MALVLKDRVKETSVTTGTGTFTLAGAVTGYQTFSAAIGNTNTCYYTIASQTLNEWEVGIGTVGAGTLARTTILASSNAGSAVTFSAGTKDVFVTYPAGKAVYQDDTGAYIPGSPVFNGNAVISDNSANAALRITQTGAGNALLVEDSANPDASPTVIAADGVVRIGSLTNNNTVYGTSQFAPGFQLYNTAGTGGFYRYAADADGSALVFAKSRNATVGSQTVVNPSDTLGYLGFAGSDGTNFTTGATITASVDGTPGTNDMPGRLVFGTTADGASSPTERMRIGNSGTISLGAAPGSESLRVTPVASAVNYWNMYGAATTGFPTIQVQGSDTNIGLVIAAKGTSAIVSQTNSWQFQNISGALQFLVASTASAVNYLQVAGAATGGNPTLSAQGSDADSGLIFTAKGNGVNYVKSSVGTYFQNVAGANQFAVTATASAVNYLSATGGATGNSAKLNAAGSDTNIDIALTPKGTGSTYSPTFAASNGLVMNNATINTSYTLPTGYNAMSAGPVTVASGVVVTVPSGSTWVVV